MGKLLLCQFGNIVATIVSIYPVLILVTDIAKLVYFNNEH